MCDHPICQIILHTVTCTSALSKTNLSAAYRIYILCLPLAQFLFLSSSWCKTQLTTHRFISSQNNLVCISAFLSASYLLFESFSSLRLIPCFISYHHQHNVHFYLSPLSSFSLQIQSDIFCMYSNLCSRRYVRKHHVLCIDQKINRKNRIFNDNVGDD